MPYCDLITNWCSLNIEPDWFSMEITKYIELIHWTLIYAILHSSSLNRAHWTLNPTLDGHGQSLFSARECHESPIPFTSSAHTLNSVTPSIAALLYCLWTWHQLRQGLFLNYFVPPAEYHPNGLLHGTCLLWTRFNPQTLICKFQTIHASLSISY